MTYISIEMNSVFIEKKKLYRLKNRIMYASAIPHLFHFKCMSTCSMMFCIFFVLYYLFLRHKYQSYMIISRKNNLIIVDNLALMKDDNFRSE